MGMQGTARTAGTETPTATWGGKLGGEEPLRGSEQGTHFSVNSKSLGEPKAFVCLSPIQQTDLDAL